MRVYLPLRDDGFEFCHPVQQEDFETINVRVNGDSQARSWDPIPMRVLHVDRGRQLKHSDSPWLQSHALIFRPSVLVCLRTILEESGELLPLQCDEGSLSMLNVTRLLDALDENASAVRRFNSGRLMMISRYVFVPERIEEVAMFKIPNLRVSPTFVTERFVEEWRAARLEGLDFKPLWSNDGA